MTPSGPGPRARRRAALAACLALLTALALPPAGAFAADRFLTLGSTTSTRDSGLLAYLLPAFEARTGVEVRVVAVGTGRALELGRRGDVDVLLVHDRRSEDRFLAEGHASLRRDVMYNDFVIVGPETDPAGLMGTKDLADALSAVRTGAHPFLSRGDDSGTHKAELRLWTAAGVDPEEGRGGWYRETGNGMGATLNTAREMQAYALTDRGTWLSFKNREGMRVVVEGDPKLRNPYGVLAINAERHPHVKAADAQALIDWLVSDETQKAIGAFRVNGEPLFFPSAGPAQVAGAQDE